MKTRIKSRYKQQTKKGIKQSINQSNCWSVHCEFALAQIGYTLQVNGKASTQREDGCTSQCKNRVIGRYMLVDLCTFGLHYILFTLIRSRSVEI